MMAVNWAIHAKNLSARTGFAVACLLVAADLFDDGSTDVAFIAASILIGIVSGTGVYWLLYWLTFWFGKEQMGFEFEGDDTPVTSPPMDAPGRPMDAMDSESFQELKFRREEIVSNQLGLRIGNRIAVYSYGITPKTMILLNTAISMGMEKVSQRSLHEYKVADRFTGKAPTASDLIEWLGSYELITPAGNHQHDITPELKSALDQLLQEQEA